MSEEQAARIRQLEEFSELSSIVTHGLKENCDRLEARLSEAVKVLEPFAAEYELWKNYPDNEVIMTNYQDFEGDITVGHLRAAKAFLATLGEENE